MLYPLSYGGFLFHFTRLCGLGWRIENGPQTTVHPRTRNGTQDGIGWSAQLFSKILGRHWNISIGKKQPEDGLDDRGTLIDKVRQLGTVTYQSAYSGR